jgi:hypothetical protein
MITDSRRPIPLVWAVSKVEDSTPIGLITLKFTQETYSPTLDNKELMLCNYYGSSITPEVPDTATELKQTAAITFNGTAATVKVGGSYKIFTPVFSDESVTVERWTISDEDGDISADTENYLVEYVGSQLKLKVVQNYYLIGKVLIIQVFGSDDSSAELKVKVVG